MKRLMILLILTGFQSMLLAQTVEEKFSLYNKKIAAPSLFVHFDKNIYTNNETVWFTGYLLNSEDPEPTILNVALVRNIDSALIQQEKFVMEKGLSFGSFVLPNLLSPGDYHFIVYINALRNDLPIALFLQDITIKVTHQRVNLAVKQLPVTDNNTRQLMISATNKDNTFFKKPPFIRYTYGQINKKTLLDGVGQLIFKLPLQKDLQDPRLIIKAVAENDSSFVSIDLMATPRKASVRFFPEGGNLVNGLPSRVGFEVKDQYNNPISIKAILYDGASRKDTLETTAYGLGIFKFTPLAGHTYYLKLASDDLTDSNYYLPQALDNGLSISFRSAIATDTLRLTLLSNIQQKINLRLHNFRETYVVTQFDLGGQLNVAIPLAGVPAGLATVTITDTLDRPLAERMVYLHYDNKKLLVAATDSLTYKRRQKVQLTIKLTHPEASGFVSIACVQENRLNTKKLNDITQYMYLENELASTPAAPFGNKLEDKSYLEQILMVRGWRRYNWSGMMQASAADTLNSVIKLGIRGNVTLNEKPLKRAVSLSLLKDSSIAIIQTAVNGSFTPTLSDLLTESGRKIWMYVNNKDNNFYRITLADEFNNFNKKLAKEYPFTTNFSASYLSNSSSLLLPAAEQAVKIKEVEIKAKPDGTLYGVGTNACGDYVCRFNILNCMNHNEFDPGSKLPEKGKNYSQRIGALMVVRTYAGCIVENREYTNAFPGINIAKEFYTDDYKDPLEPALRSTLYWNYGAQISKGKDLVLSFYTGDITGRFKVIVQGLTNNDVVSAQAGFNVKP